MPKRTPEEWQEFYEKLFYDWTHDPGGNLAIAAFAEAVRKEGLDEASAKISNLSFRYKDSPCDPHGYEEKGYDICVDDALLEISKLI